MGKNIKMIYYTIVILAVIAYVYQIASSGSPMEEGSASGFGLNLTYVLSFVAILGAVISSVLFIVHNPKGAKKILIGIGVLAVICIIAYSISSGELGPDYAKYDVTTESKSKLIDMGMYLTVILGLGSVVLAIVTEGISLFKN
jgi:hypothetical protein